MRDAARAREHSVLFHGGALGDLALTIQLMLMLEPRPAALTIVSRVDPGDLSAFDPSIRRLSHDLLGTHWLHGPTAGRPSQALRDLVSGRSVIHTLASRDSNVHETLAALEPAELYGIDPRPRDSDRHIVEQWRADLESQNSRFAPAALESCRLQLPGRAPAAGARRDEWVIAPGSGGRAKCWPLANFLAIASILRDAGFAIRFLIGPVEVERWQPAELDRLSARFAVTTCPTPSDLVSLLCGARALIGNDSGASHLAALLDTPTATIFGPTQARQWCPLARDGIVIQGDPAAAGPANWGLRPETVAGRILDWLNRRTANPHATAGPHARSCE